MLMCMFICLHLSNDYRHFTISLTIMLPTFLSSYRFYRSENVKDAHRSP